MTPPAEGDHAIQIGSAGDRKTTDQIVVADFMIEGHFARH